MNEFGGKRAQNEGALIAQSKTKCLLSPNALVSLKVQRRRCRGTAGLASLPGALFYRQSMRSVRNCISRPRFGNGHWKLKVRHSMQLTGAQKPCKVCAPRHAELCPFGGSCSWGHMQTIPNLAELTLDVCPNPREFTQRGRISLVHSARMAYEDASWLESSAKLRMAVRQWQTAFWSLCHTKHCMVPSASWYNERNWR